MTSGVVDAERRRIRVGPFMWGAGTDLAVFGGSAAVALGAVLAWRALGQDAELPEWGWVALVLAVDVAHVWSTIFRTYLDGEELARRPRLYFFLPIALWIAGALLHAASPLAFWRTLAYLAVFHFVRQQAGWVAIYRARAGERSRIDRILDDAAIYLGTGVPLLIWHATLPRPFSWFVHGDFIGTPRLAALITPSIALLLAVLSLFVFRQAQTLVRERRINLGKITVVGTTALLWWCGIVGARGDFEFTITNVVIHGVPYFALLWHYARFRAEEPTGAKTLGARVVAHGLVAFFGVLLALAFLEEMVWDRAVWHDRPWLFGGSEGLPGSGGGSAHAMPSTTSWLMTLLVPLLALPQATHYALDAFLWRRRDTGPAQARALGFGGPAPR